MNRPISASLSKWQGSTVALLFVGYAGYYICRSNLALAKGPLAEEFASVGVTKDSITTVASIAVLCYSIGKLVNGTICDFVGGRRMFLFGMFGSVACTLLFLASPNLAAWLGNPPSDAPRRALAPQTGGVLFALFLGAFSLNRFIQSMGWGALVKIASAWFSFHAYGRVMGVLCMSYLFGDSLARLALGGVLYAGLGWRGMFAFAALALFAIAAVNALFLRARPADVGLAPPPVSPANLFGELGGEESPRGLWDLFGPYLTSFAFWLVLLMSVTLSFVRESLNYWNNDYIQVAAGVSESAAAMYSALFPFFGAVAVLAMGFLSDRVSQGKRGLWMAASLTLLLPILAVMALVPAIQGTFLPIAFIACVGFLSLAPYAFLSGAIALDLGGKRGSSTAAGVVDAFGYALGSVPGMKLVDYLVLGDRIEDWRPFFLVMFALVAGATMACIGYWFFQERRGPKASGASR